MVADAVRRVGLHGVSAEVAEAGPAFETRRVVLQDGRDRGAAFAGVVEGEGRDQTTRSGGAGRLEFSVLENDAATSTLSVAMTYSITGPLAQFSRGPVVDAIVAELLRRFAENVAAATRGRDVRDESAAAGIRLTLRALWRRLVHWLSR